MFVEGEAATMVEATGEVEMGRDDEQGTAEPKGKVTPPTPAVVCLESDLYFAVRLEDVIRAEGGRPVNVATPEEFVDAVDHYFPVLALMDLDTPGDWYHALQRVKLRPQTKPVPVYAFGSHVDTAALQAARKAGADHAWARSRMMEQLVEVVRRHIHPPIRYPEGWDEPLPEKAREGIEEFNRGDYFEQHELLEEAWMTEPRPVRDLYQGILQIGLAFLQIERDNWLGSLKMFRRGLPKLRDLPPVIQGVHLAELRDAAEAIHAEVTELGPGGLHTFDRSRFPKIRVD
jgi:predicted metal-dependent hydrolase